jgi:serine/threonine-protein kinase
MECLGRYEILEELGQGAMGTVYRARDPKIDRIVALKTIRLVGGAAEIQDYRERFFREAQAAGRLSHPGIVTIYDVGEQEQTQTPYIVMEHIGGETLEKLVTAAGTQRLPLENTLDLVQQVAEALDYAHAQGIVHRDIKPSNIIVTPEGRAKIADFGIAKLSVAQLTTPGQILGTPSYMSPEQLSGGAVDGRSDLFALGVILYWMLTGDKPFPGDTTTAVSFKIVYKDPVPVTQLNPSLPPTLDPVMDQALAKNPDRRYQRGKEFAQDLDDLRHRRPPRSLLAGPRVRATEQTLAPPRPAAAPVTPAAVLAPRPPTTTVAAQPVPAQPQGRWLAATAALLVLTLGGLGGWWWVNREHAAHEQATPTQTSESAPASALPEPETTPPPTPTGSTLPGPTKTPAAPAARPTRTEPGTAAVTPARLNVVSRHSFRQAQVSIWLEETLAYQGMMRGQRRGASRNVQGLFAARLEVPPGWHNIRVRVLSHDDGGFDDTAQIQAEFGANTAHTLEVYFSRAGALGNPTRKLSLRWRK